MPINTFPGLNVPTMFKARAHGTVNTVLGSGGFTTVTLDAKDYDTNNNFAGNTYTAPVTGWYIASWCLESILANNPQDFVASLFINGTERARGSGTTKGTNGDAYRSVGSDCVFLSVGDTVTLRGYNNGGNACNITTQGTYTPFLAIHHLSPVPGAVAISNPNYSPPTAYSPTFSQGVTLNNGTLAGQYSQYGKIVQFSISFIAGSSSVFAASQWQITLPVAPALTGTLGQSCSVFAYNGTYWVCGADIVSSSIVVPFANNTGGFTNLIPFTWATGHQMRINGSYIAA